jgi:TATA-box binding protein (TBP) (component of TFIID and TFIIIB)
MLASLTIVQMLREIQPECHFHVQDCEIQNVVANVVIPGSTPHIPPDSRLNIHAMMTHLNASVQEHVCQYRKNLFPGLVYRPAHSPVVILCFTSGKCVITGGKTVDDVHVGWRMLWRNIRRFVVDPQGRAFLDSGKVLLPRLPAAPGGSC